MRLELERTRDGLLRLVQTYEESLRALVVRAGVAASPCRSWLVSGLPPSLRAGASGRCDGCLAGHGSDPDRERGAEGAQGCVGHAGDLLTAAVPQGKCDELQAALDSARAEAMRLTNEAEEASHAKVRRAATEGGGGGTDPRTHAPTHLPMQRERDEMEQMHLSTNQALQRQVHRLTEENAQLQQQLQDLAKWRQRAQTEREEADYIQQDREAQAEESVRDPASRGLAFPCLTACPWPDPARRPGSGSRWPSSRPQNTGQSRIGTSWLAACSCLRSSLSWPSRRKQALDCSRTRVEGGRATNAAQWQFLALQRVRRRPRDSFA